MAGGCGEPDGLTEADLIAIRDNPPEGLEPPPDHSEEMLLRFLAPALGEAYDAGRIDADRRSPDPAGAPGRPRG